MLLVVAATEGELRGAGGLDVETLTCGIGPIDAAVATAARLAREPRPAALLHVGIAGARRASTLAPGTVVVGDRAIYCDSASRLVVRELAPDASLLDAARAALPDATVRAIGTSGDVDGSVDCDVEGMEGFAVLRAAQVAGVPAIEVRVISNEIEEADRGKWRFDIALDGVAAILAPLASAFTATR